MRRGRVALVAVAGGATSAALVIVLLLHTIDGPDADTVRPLAGTIALSALVALAAAVPGLRDERHRPVAMEGVELALVSLSILALFCFVFYVILGPGYS